MVAVQQGGRLSSGTGMLLYLALESKPVRQGAPVGAPAKKDTKTSGLGPRWRK